MAQSQHSFNSLTQPTQEQIDHSWMTECRKYENTQTVPLLLDTLSISHFSRKSLNIQVKQVACSQPKITVVSGKEKTEKTHCPNQ